VRRRPSRSDRAASAPTSLPRPCSHACSDRAITYRSHAHRPNTIGHSGAYISSCTEFDDSHCSTTSPRSRSSLNKCLGSLLSVSSSAVSAWCSKARAGVISLPLAFLSGVYVDTYYEHDSVTACTNPPRDRTSRSSAPRLNTPTRDPRTTNARLCAWPVQSPHNHTQHQTPSYQQPRCYCVVRHSHAKLVNARHRPVIHINLRRTHAHTCSNSAKSSSDSPSSSSASSISSASARAIQSRSSASSCT
jgi:hypothetical protein